MQQAKQGEFKPFNASKWRIGIVTALFNKPITDQLKQSAIERTAEYAILKSNTTIIDVAGAVEIPLVLQRMAQSGKYQALLAIGCVIKGTTPHFDYVCKFVTEGVLRIQLDNNMPIGFGIITCNNMAEAQARASLGGAHIDAVMHQALALQGV